MTIGNDGSVTVGQWDDAGGLYTGTFTDGKDASGNTAPGVLRLKTDDRSSLVKADSTTQTHLDYMEAENNSIGNAPAGRRREWQCHGLRHGQGLDDHRHHAG